MDCSRNLHKLRSSASSPWLWSTCFTITPTTILILGRTRAHQTIVLTLITGLPNLGIAPHLVGVIETGHLRLNMGQDLLLMVKKAGTCHLNLPKDFQAHALLLMGQQDWAPMDLCLEACLRRHSMDIQDRATLLLVHQAVLLMAHQ